MLKYLTRGSSGVDGLKIVFKYVVVRFAYAGESNIDRRSVVNEEGRDEREDIESDEEDCFDLESEMPDAETIEGSEAFLSSEAAADLVASETSSFSACVLPSPRYSFKER